MSETECKELKALLMYLKQHIPDGDFNALMWRTAHAVVALEEFIRRDAAARAREKRSLLRLRCDSV
jgi:hypothetical protein